MEIKLKQGDRLPIPEGCKAVIEGNLLLIEKKEPEFRDGDVLACNEEFGRCPFIFKGYDEKGFLKFYTGIGYGGDLIISTSSNERWGKSELSYATEEEKQLLFDKMKEKGLRWNAEEKKVEKIKWQPQNGERYFFVNAFCETGSIICLENYIDELLEKACNQLRTKELADKAAEAVRETLRRFHEENKIE